MSASSKPDADAERSANVMVLSPERAQRIADAFAVASPRTDDDSWRLPDGTPVTESEYFAWVAEVRVSGVT